MSSPIGINRKEALIIKIQAPEGALFFDPNHLS